MVLHLDPKKFSELPDDSAVDGTELVPVVNDNAGTKENKKVTVRDIKAPRSLVIESDPTPTINTDLVDFVEITEQAEDITDMSANLTGTPRRDQVLHIAITATDAFGIVWGDEFEDGAEDLPATINTDRLDVLFVRNMATNKWRCMAK